MATTSQVNIINISNLPEAQEVFDGNYFIVQNNLGTQIIDWVNISVLKLDVDGNGAFNGTLTGAGIDVGSAIIGTVSGSSYSSNGIPGQTADTNFYNTFQITNGLVTSASYIFGSPEYLDILQTQLPAATAALVSAYQANYTAYRTFTNFDGSGNATLTFLTLPQGLNSADFSSADFNLAQTTGVPVLTTFPVFSNITTDNSNPPLLSVDIATNQTNLAGVEFTCKVQKFYNF